MRYFFACTVFLVFFTTKNCCAHAIRFTMEGHTYHKTGKVILLACNNNNQFIPFDSTVVTNGSFCLSDTLGEPTLFLLQCEGEEIELFAGNEHIIINQKDSATQQITVSGSVLTNDYNSYRTTYLTPLSNQLQNIKKTPVNLPAAQQGTIDSLQRVENLERKAIPDSAAVFIRQHPASFVSLYLLKRYAADYNIILLNALYKMLDNQLKQFPSAIFVQQKISFGLHESAKCPDFSVPDSNHQLVTLHSFEGNYLFIDFWASWCVPCIANLPFVQQATEQFKNNNFKVLTASLDNNAVAWQRALERFKMNGISRNVLLKNTFRNPMALLFHLYYIPYNVLVDPEGNIISRNIDGKALQQKLQEIFDTVDKEKKK